MGSIFCFIVTLPFAVLQVLISVLDGFWSLLGVTPPNIQSTFGSIFGCNM
jgi:hypothetical protein